MKSKRYSKDTVHPIREKTVKVAIPLFKERVSPHFGASSTFLLVEMDGSTICGEAMWDLQGEGPVEIARRLAELGVNKLICGGIQSKNKAWLMDKGIMVVDNQKGVAREVVRSHLGLSSDRLNLRPTTE